jgi:diketogulonate reductase-like aldo/keto reductase
MVPLTGTKDPAHMREDLDIARFTLTEDELATIERAG